MKTCNSPCMGCHCHNGDSATCRTKPECTYDDAMKTCNSPCMGCHCHNSDSAACAMTQGCSYDNDAQMCIGTTTDGPGNNNQPYQCWHHNGDCGRCSQMPGCKCNGQSCVNVNGADDLLSIVSPAAQTVPALLLHAAFVALVASLTMRV
jgi:hypothetical protein